MKECSDTLTTNTLTHTHTHKPQRWHHSRPTTKQTFRNTTTSIFLLTDQKLMAKLVLKGWTQNSLWWNKGLWDLLDPRMWETQEVCGCRSTFQPYTQHRAHTFTTKYTTSVQQNLLFRVFCYLSWKLVGYTNMSIQSDKITLYGCLCAI